MEKDLLSFNAQVGIGTNFSNKVRLLFILLFVIFITPFSAQETKPEVNGKSSAIITVVGDAFIYSKDKAFNEQVSKNKKLQENSKIEINQNNELIISSKAKRKSKTVSSSKKKAENIVLASKKSDKYKLADLPKKETHLQIKDLDGSTQFFSGSSSGKISFISPSNDSHSFKYFICYSNRTETTCLRFLHNINYFYNNDNSKLQVFHDDFSVRPPPSLI